MSEFCVKCSEKEAEIEILRSRHQQEMQCMMQKNAKLQSEVEALSMDVAFYSGDIKLTSNNN